MNTDYNQIEVDEADRIIHIPKRRRDINVLTNTEDGSTLSVEMPQNVLLKEKQNQKVQKHSYQCYKTARLETGAKINVLFLSMKETI